MELPTAPKSDPKFALEPLHSHRASAPMNQAHLVAGRVVHVATDTCERPRVVGGLRISMEDIDRDTGIDIAMINIVIDTNVDIKMDDII